MVKRYKARFECLLVILMSLALITTCGSTLADGSPSSGTPEGKTFTIGLSSPASLEFIVLEQARYVKQFGEEKGWTVHVVNADGDADRQVSQIQTLLTHDLDLLLLTPVDVNAVGVALRQAVDEGVIVAVIDRFLDTDPYSFRVTYDPYIIGRTMAQEAVNAGIRGNYVILGGDNTNTLVYEFTRGKMDVLQPYIDSGEITIVMEQYCLRWSPEQGLMHAENALTVNNNDIQAFLCANDNIAAGAVQALETVGLQGQVFITGQDSEAHAIVRISEGTQNITLFKNPAITARHVIDVAELYLTDRVTEADALASVKNEYGTNMFYLDPVVINKDNYREILVDTGIVTLN